MIVSDRHVKEVFFKLESDARVFDYCVKDESLYFILRFSIELYFRHPRKPLIEPAAKRRIKRFLNSLGRFFNRESLEIVPAEALFVSTSDWTNDAGESVELADIIKYYKSKNQTVNFVQPEFTGKKIVRHEFYDSYTRIDTKSRVNFNSGDKNALRSFLAYLSVVLNRDYKLVYEQFADYTAYTLSMAGQLEKLIRRAGARMVFARSIYTEPWILMACKKTGAKCVEVQHGAIHPDSIYYQSFEGKPNHGLLFPDYILTIGEEWRKIILDQHNHYSAAAVRNLGCNEATRWSPEVHSRFELLICLQHGIFSVNDILVPFFRRYAGALADAGINVKLRPHPHAVAEALETYREFEGPGFEIVNSRKVSFYENLQHARALISPSSMCLYEAVAFGIPAISFEKFRAVSISKGLLYCNSPEQLFQEISEIRDGSYRQQDIEYLSPFKPEVLPALVPKQELTA